MTHAIAVIGAGFGDEGKGLLVDRYAADNPTYTVVRFNGGGQASHTVQTPDDRRHVFSHVPAGAFAGNPGHLSRYFVTNPFVFRDELRDLDALGVKPAVTVDPRAPVTTPYDMLVNQIVEDARGRYRHGSCGLGFGETIERHEDGRFPVTFRDLGAGGLRQRLEHIRDEWLPERLKALGVYETAANSWMDVIASDKLIDDYVGAAREFARCPMRRDEDLRREPGIILEGAQGLLLDQDLGWFPHVTRSRTGLPNAVDIARRADADRMEVTYVSRIYATRHGAGPLPHELMGLPYVGAGDDTNTPNQYQGTLRYGWPDIDLLGRVVAADMVRAGGMPLDASLAVTCLDQIDDKTATLARGEKTMTMPTERALAAFEARSGVPLRWTAHGPTRDAVWPRASGSGVRERPVATEAMM